LKKENVDAGAAFFYYRLLESIFLDGTLLVVRNVNYSFHIEDV